jgi:rod shape-determining protein MreC
VRSVERRAEGGFARVLLAPAAPGDGVRHVLVLAPLVGTNPAARVAAPPASASSTALPASAPGARR